MLVEVPFRGWVYYLELLKVPRFMGYRPWIMKVYPDWKELWGWKLGWGHVSLIWGRQKQSFMEK